MSASSLLVCCFQARAEVQLLGSRAIRPLDVQGLLLWVLADGMNPNWCFVKACDFLPALNAVAR